MPENTSHKNKDRDDDHGKFPHVKGFTNTPIKRFWLLFIALVVLIAMVGSARTTLKYSQNNQINQKVVSDERVEEESIVEATDPGPVEISFFPLIADEETKGKLINLLENTNFYVDLNSTSSNSDFKIISYEDNYFLVKGYYIEGMDVYEIPAELSGYFQKYLEKSFSFEGNRKDYWIVLIDLPEQHKVRVIEYEKGQELNVIDYDGNEILENPYGLEPKALDMIYRSNSDYKIYRIAETGVVNNCREYQKIQMKNLEKSTVELCDDDVVIAFYDSVIKKGLNGVVTQLNLDSFTERTLSTTDELPNELYQTYRTSSLGYGENVDIIGLGYGPYPTKLEAYVWVLDDDNLIREKLDTSKMKPEYFSKDKGGFYGGTFINLEPMGNDVKYKVDGNVIKISAESDQNENSALAEVEILALPLNKYQYLLDEFEVLNLLSMSTLDRLANAYEGYGIGGGGGPTYEPEMAMNYNSIDNVLDIFMYGYFSWPSEQVEWASPKIGIRRLTYDLSTHNLIADTGYMYMDGMSIAAYSGNWIVGFRDNLNKIILGASGGDGCGGGSMYSHVDLDASGKFKPNRIIGVFASGCMTVDYVKEAYPNSPVYGEQIRWLPIGKEKIYSSEERYDRSEEEGGYYQSLDNISALNLETGKSRKIYQFASAPYYIQDHTYQYLKDHDLDEQDYENFMYFIQYDLPEGVDFPAYDPTVGKLYVFNLESFEVELLDENYSFND